MLCNVLQSRTSILITEFLCFLSPSTFPAVIVILQSTLWAINSLIFSPCDVRFASMIFTYQVLETKWWIKERKIEVWHQFLMQITGKKKKKRDSFHVSSLAVSPLVWFITGFKLVLKRRSLSQSHCSCFSSRRKY